ncbi:2-oxo acid dehydrogenase subunit E2 [Terrisporobacter petrolearius]|uniref:dihydrolipoamide acetyltransferase family protein n=1 Tax=Terrisporobacter petrolearius TaxID=1460447 RepID=UPI001D16BDE3|nr:dihydrolipoamide acetyltransferase family protein [Terrisporobacter petrolearius]MCC3863107.1 2-oxo acid dehydrogenase subunit E2 [Terrisporobacter petrolearius]
MANLLVLPKLGLTMTEGKIGTWYAEEGDSVEEGDILYELETDKLVNEVEAKESGVILKVFVEPGDVLPCLAPVAIIGEEGEDISNLIPNETKEEKEKENINIEKKIVEEKSIEKSGVVIASPAAKKFAKENSIDINKVIGTGPKGRIILEDVEKYMNNKPVLSQIKEKVVPMSQMRKIISKKMSESWNTCPAVTYDIKVDLSNISKLRDEYKEKNIKISYTDVLIYMLTQTLEQFPLLNSSIDGENIILKENINIGVAVATDAGLLVPVIKDADKKNIEEISSQLKEISSKAKDGSLSPDYLTGGTFTITNLGMYGIESFSPIINLPEVAILGIGAIKKEIVEVENGFVFKPFMKLCLSADHRVIDGAVAAQFLSQLKSNIENMK